MAASPQRLLLASASPRRAELLARMGLRFSVQPTHVAEDDSGRDGPEAMVRANARLKAATLAASEPDALTLGSDTTVALDDRVLSKPSDRAEARAMLRQLSGREHTVYTAVALEWPRGGLSQCFVERSAVHFKRIDEATIDAYFAQVNPLDKAGAYGIQAGRELIIDDVDGSVDNVMGLPTERLAEVFMELGFDFRDEEA